MLDYDGTLVPLAQRPEQVRPPRDLVQILADLAVRPGLKLAIISGRPLEDLCRLLPIKGAYLAGSHGRYLSVPGTRGGEPRRVIRLGPPGPGRKVWEAVRSLAQAAAAGVKGLWVEDKEEGIALHYREAEGSQVEGVLLSFVRNVEPWLESEGLELLHGNKVLEVRIRGVHKGLAVEYLRSLHPRAFPVYLGDDTTDEDAFRALQDRGLAVQVGPPRPSGASLRLPSPAAVKEFLALLHGAGRQTISAYRCQ